MHRTYLIGAAGVLFAASLLAACGTPATTAPTSAPAATAAPALAPTEAPTLIPTVVATTAPTEAPTSAPTTVPTEAPAPEPTAVPTSDVMPAFMPPTEDYPAIAESVRVSAREALGETPMVVSVLGQEGDFAAALVAPFKQRSQYAWLQRVGDSWTVLFLGATPSSTVLSDLGLPESLTFASNTYSVADAMSAQLQDARGTGLDGTIIVQGIDGDYARVDFTPTDTMMQEGFTSFMKNNGGTWEQISAGSAFDQASLRQLGVPESLW